MKHCTVIPIKDQKTMYVKGVKSAYRVPQYRAMLLMSEMSKVHRGFQYRVMLLISKFQFKLCCNSK